MTRHYTRRARLLTREERLAVAFEWGRRFPDAPNPYGSRTSGAALHREFARGQAEARPVVREPQPARLSGTAL